MPLPPSNNALINNNFMQNLPNTPSSNTSNNLDAIQNLMNNTSTPRPDPNIDPVGAMKWDIAHPNM